MNNKNTSFYYDFNYSLPFVDLILGLLGKKDGPDQYTDTANREWFSQPRLISSNQTECVTVNFRLPLSVSEISTEILRMPCRVEVWYQDRSNNWREVLDKQRIPLRINVSRSDTKSWYKYFVKCYPIVAKKVQFRITRTFDDALTDTPYPVGMRNTLIRRNVYDRREGGVFEDETDVMGNVVSKYVKDWDATRAADDNYLTFWKSAPQPDPSAVVSLYLDVRDDNGDPQIIDKVYIDPVYTGQHLNLYYSTDNLTGTRFLSPITLAPAAPVVNMTQRANWGLYDELDPDATGDSSYTFPLGVGPQNRQDAWIGVEYRPNYDSDDANLNNNPVLFSAEQDEDSSSANPLLTYDPVNRTFTLQLDGDHVYTSEEITQEFAGGESLRVVAGWRYGAEGADTVYIEVYNQQRQTIATLLDEAATLPALVSFDGTASIANTRGTIANLVVKLESYTGSSGSFLANPTYYCDPDPVIPDEGGNYPSTSLDNAIYVAPFVAREHGSGGSDASHFEDKEWTPVWRDYTAIRGMLHLPRPISMKYLKLEFTNLTEQPYPIYEAGIETQYKVFPIQVIQQSSIGPKLNTGQGGFLGLGTFISVNGVRSVNWLDPVSVLNAIGGVIGPTTPPVIINTGLPYVTDRLPNSGITALESSRRVEAASSYVYAREAISPFILAQDQYNTLIKAEGLQAIQPYVDVPWSAIEAANPGAVTKVRSTGTVPIRGTDWWIYPGQQLKVPAAVMKKITETDVVTERKLTLESRVRFNTSSVHRYETRTITRDAAVAYFAGLREVQPYTSTYITGEDKPVFDFPTYDSTQWSYDPDLLVRAESGPVSVRYPNTPLVLSKKFQTQSDFAKVNLDFQDSGLVRSNAMWADIDQTVPAIDDTALSPYFNIIPDDIPTGNWADLRAKWADGETVWGFKRGLVNISIDPDRRYLGRRVVHFTRAAGAGEAGVSLDQWTNLTPGAQFRMGAVFFRPTVVEGNEIVMTLTRSDGVEIHRETLDFAPGGRWFERTTQFVEIPETLVNSSFSAGLSGWIPTGGSWTASTTVGRTDLKSARLETNGTDSTLTSIKSQVLNGTTATATAWIKWEDLASGTEPIRIVPVFYDNDDDVVEVPDAVMTIDGATPDVGVGGWVPISLSVEVPTGAGVTQIAFRVIVDSSWGTGGYVWVDDFSVNVPGAPRQQYTAALTVVGDEAEELYVADLYTEITPIRYFAQFGVAEDPFAADEPVWDTNADGSPSIIEVTDLRYTRDVATVTRSRPANALRVQAVINSPRAWAFGCKITPSYLK
jgi:hypothetical protein